ncbi:MAG: hypothetical protein ACSLFN_00655 [Candidatus Limnocylindrales bacterium]
MPHLVSRGVLLVLAAFLAATAISGALFVVPGLPMGWIEGGPFADYTLPAVALGIVGALAIVTFVALLIRPEVAGAAAVTTGIAMVAFELVEIGVVGFTLIEDGIGEPVAWLQVVFIAIGLITAGMGAALWSATADDRRRLERTSTHAAPRSL